MAGAPGCAVIPVASAPLLPAKGVWTVTVAINGHPLRLIVDTGAERTLLPEAVVARLGLPRDARHETRTVGIGGLSITRDARVAQFAIGGTALPVRSVTVASFDLPVVSGTPLDGLLGADVLSAFDVDLDIRDDRLTLYRARECPAAGPPWSGPYLSVGRVERERDRLLIPIVLDGAAGMATLDSGAQHTAVSAAFAARAGVGAAALGQDRRITAHGASADKLSVPVHRFSLLRIGPATIRDPVLPVLPIPEQLGDGLAGADFLAGRRIWLSYASLRVFVTPLGAAPAVAMAMAAPSGAADRCRLPPRQPLVEPLSGGRQGHAKARDTDDMRRAQAVA